MSFCSVLKTREPHRELWSGSLECAADKSANRLIDHVFGQLIGLSEEVECHGCAADRECGGADEHIVVVLQFDGAVLPVVGECSAVMVGEDIVIVFLVGEK